MDYCRQRNWDAVEDNRILKEEFVMAREGGEINDGDLIENENADDEMEGDNYAF